jgi:phenylpropionate dioxygenase-like ring-hydroxylating dioxygenase large terminal subunit
VGVVKDIDTTLPHKIDVLGGQFVLWCAEDGSWHAQEDLCPHRLAPLSEGKVVGNTLQCSYHGWRFNGEGKCVALPQAPEDGKSRAMNNPRACVTSYPVRVQYGMIWMWPDNSESRWIESAANAVSDFPPEMDGPYIEFLPLFVRDFPYSIETFFDNVLDPSHVPWSHHGVIGNRDKAEPIILEPVMESCPKGIATKFVSNEDSAAASSSAMKRGGDRTTFLRYGAPHTMFYDMIRADGSQSKLIAYATPTKPGWCKVYSVSLDGRIDTKNKMLSLLPTWMAHMTFLEGGDGDQVLLQTQERLLPKLEKGWRQFYLPTQADTMVGMWRNWYGKYVGKDKGGPYMLNNEWVEDPVATTEAFAPKTKEEILDRWHTHTKDCKACRTAMNNFATLSKATAIAAAVAGLLAVQALVGIWNLSGGLGPIPAQGVQLGSVTIAARQLVTVAFAVAAYVLAKLSMGFDGSKQKFIFQDYIHGWR